MKRERFKARKGGAYSQENTDESTEHDPHRRRRQRNPMNANKSIGMFEEMAVRVAAAARVGRLLDARGARSVFFFAAGVLACCLMWLFAAVAAEPALAQEGGGGGDAIQSTLANVRDYIAGTLLVLGGIGFVVSLGLKAASPINENAQYLANYGMKSSFIAVLAGAIVNPIMQIIQGLAAGG